MYRVVKLPETDGVVFYGILNADEELYGEPDIYRVKENAQEVVDNLNKTQDEQIQC